MELCTGERDDDGISAVLTDVYELQDPVDGRCVPASPNSGRGLLELAEESFYGRLSRIPATAALKAVASSTSAMTPIWSSHTSGGTSCLISSSST